MDGLDTPAGAHAALPLEGAHVPVPLERDPGDPGLRRALAAVHADPAAAWSLARLASLSGMSRSVFAERFRSRLGTSAMRYLASWRIRKACALLANGALSVGEVGRRVGYGSEAAFNRAFRSRIGEPPGRYRRRLARRGLPSPGRPEKRPVRGDGIRRSGSPAKKSGRAGNPPSDVPASILPDETGMRPGGDTP